MDRTRQQELGGLDQVSNILAESTECPGDTVLTFHSHRVWFGGGGGGTAQVSSILAKGQCLGGTMLAFFFFAFFNVQTRFNLGRT